MASAKLLERRPGASLFLAVLLLRLIVRAVGSGDDSTGASCSSIASTSATKEMERFLSTALNATMMRSLIARQAPFVITSPQPVPDRWDPALIAASLHDDDHTQTYTVDCRQGPELPAREAVRRVAVEAASLRAQDVKVPPALLESLLWPPELWESEAVAPFLWLSRWMAKWGLRSPALLYFAGAEHRVGLHDHGNNLEGSFHLVLAGEKDVVIFPPSERALLYIRPIDGNTAMGPSSPLDAETRRRFPALARASRGHHATLAAGDVLYMPDGCLHWFRYRRASFALNWPFSRSAAAAAAALLHEQIFGALTPAYLRSSHDEAIVGLKDWVAFEKAAAPLGHWGVSLTLDAVVGALRVLSLLSTSWCRACIPPLRRIASKLVAWQLADVGVSLGGDGDKTP